MAQIGKDRKRKQREGNIHMRKTGLRRCWVEVVNSDGALFPRVAQKPSGKARGKVDRLTPLPVSRDESQQLKLLPTEYSKSGIVCEY